ncbi:MAG TPA: class I tRNA ligase family protein, partial [Candidatus Acidoferrales bacterium]
DTDVLDTWFSSGLWPFSTLGWPDDTEDLRTFYPTSLLISGYDILFFWDARMVMLGLHLTGRAPFNELYLHSLVRDEHGQKMSKMRGNVVDPLDWLEKFGTDALRFALMIKAAPGTDISLGEESVLGYRAFANKIWNAARFLFVNLEKFEAGGDTLEDLASPASRAAAPHKSGAELPLVDRWMFSRFARIVPRVNDALREFRFHETAHEIYHFFWGDFCDWYIEWCKPRLNSEDREAARAAWRNILSIFEEALRLLHPLMPFLTEELWHQFPQAAGARSIALARFPAPPAAWIDEHAERDMAQLQEVIAAARNLRAELKLDPRKPMEANFFAATPHLRALVETNIGAVKQFAALSALNFVNTRMNSADGPLRSTSDFDIRIPYETVADIPGELAALAKEKERLEGIIAGQEKQLGNPAFSNKAPAAVIAKLQESLAERKAEHAKVTQRISQLA